MATNTFSTYGKEAVSARFLLGGIGTGNISVGARGEYTDFELFGSPAKGMDSPYTFFAVRTEDPAGRVCTKALEAEVQPPYNHSHGFNAWEIGGLPRFRESRMSSEYPFVTVRLADPSMPVEAELEAFTPFVPLETDDSSLPGAVLRYRVRNVSAEPQAVSLAGSFANLCNYAGRDIWHKPLFEGESVNTYVERGGFRGIHFTTASKRPEELDYLEMALLTTEREDVFYREYWNEGGWWDGLQDFWNDFAEDGRLDAVRELRGSGNRMHVSDIKMGSLGAQKTVAPGETACFEFLLTWQRPNRIRSWDQLQDPAKNGRQLIRNYSAKFGGALEVADRLSRELPRLEGESRAFARALYGSSYPAYVIEALADNITVLRSSTCFRVEDGTFFGYEGCFDNAGCCPGNCTHVWNYAQTLAFLFPELERSMRRTEFLDETDESGRMTFRARRYLMEDWETPPAADGQLGCVVRLYREWMLSGDEAFLRELWPNARRALEFAYAEWDSDGDGLLDSKQHNTYDIEFYGPNLLVNSIWFAALKAGAAISRHLGDGESAARYEETASRAAELADARLFNGEYYVQDIPDVNAWKYQFGQGCLADQLLGQELAHVNGLGYLLNPAHVRQAVRAVYEHNFHASMEGHCNLQRTYALNDEPGLLLCSWPRGGRPDIPFVYSDEVWTGTEYQVAAHLIYEGFVEEGLRVVEAVRSRQDGVRRSPWNEVECGHHYARSLASWGVLLALSGFHCDLPGKRLTFRPVTDEAEFSTFFSCGCAWGVFRRFRDETGAVRCVTEVLHGSLEGVEVVCE